MTGKTASTLRREKMNTPLSQTVDLFVATKKTEGLSPKTTNWYRWILQQFTAFLGDPPLNQVTLNDARRFIASLQDRTTRYEHHAKHPVKQGGLSPYTISAYVRTLKVFGKYLAEDALTKTNLFDRLKRPKLPKLSWRS